MKLFLLFIGLNHDYIYSFTKSYTEFNINLYSSRDIENFNPIPSTIQSITKCSSYSQSLLITLMLLATPQISYAAKGAFEMDAEYYLKNIFGTSNNKKPAIFNSNPIYVSPRKLNATFSSLILQEIRRSIIDEGSVSLEYLENMVNKDLPFAIKYFKLFVPIRDEDISDQYYFDMILYLYYLEAGKILPTSIERVKLRTLVGANLLNLFLREYREENGFNEVINSIKNVKSLPNNKNISDRLNYGVSAIKSFDIGIKSILDKYKLNGMLDGYIFENEDLTDVELIQANFQDGLSVNFQITLQSPATILGFIQQYKMDTFFHPEIFATVISALAIHLGYKISFEDYLLDNYYRKENYNVQAQDILLEFGLSLPLT